MNDRKMNRGKSQALYKYLPGSWIDFNIRGQERGNYSAKVIRWNSEQLTGINKNRLIAMLNREISSFENQYHGGEVPPTTGFASELTTDTWDVLTPKSGGDERGIIAGMDPLLFQCPDCHKVYQFENEEDYSHHRKCDNCNKYLEQIRQIYFCKCGYATGKHQGCKKHGFKKLYKYDEYSFKCNECNTKIEMALTCPVCGKRLYPRPNLASEQYFPFSLSFVDLIDEKLDNFLTKTNYGAFSAVSLWTGRIKQDEFDSLLKDGIISDPAGYQKVYNQYVTTFSPIITDEKTLHDTAKAAADKECGNDISAKVDDLKKKVMIKQDQIIGFAEKLMEYHMVKVSENSVDLDEAKSAAKELNTNADPDSYDRIADKFGISDARVISDVPFVTCSYGYTRVSPKYEEGVQLHAFTRENNKKGNVYAVKLRTEGVLFEFDRVKIIRWLERNEVINATDMPDIDSDEDVKLWFMNNIRLDAITTFDEIEETQYPITKYVYSLVHSLSHLLIKAASELCGLNKDSISEYLFPSIPAVMIYCQNSQGFNLGALFNTFEAYFDKWIENAAKKSRKCIFDPVCIERYRACTGCLFLNEISCQHFNQDLDRRLVTGYFDRETKKRLYGFWEED